MAKENVESAIESTPRWVLSVYVGLMRCLKRLLAWIGILPKIDKRAKSDRRFHYLRSLLAIHQLDDMIQLDVPWWTYDAIAEIDAYIQKLGYLPTVFEYGSGASTLWLAKRAEKVISIEHDKRWFDNLKNKLTDVHNVELILVQPDKNISERKYLSQKAKNVSFKSYVTKIAECNQTFDVIIVDGRSREACLEECRAFLKPHGIILFDNSNRKRYQNAIQHASLKIQRFYGRVPGSPFNSETSILHR
ncbi:MAG: class I SAM-dependent methyltransferase [Gammaproteobacteria bacterium]|jgi:SAM-dependent methyltransferase|nr:class I SAM-dependent methyltransferase [Gammaproteobacteria bacterium]